MDSTEVNAYFDLKLDTLFSVYTDSIDDIGNQYQSEVCSKSDNDVQKLKLQNGD